MSKQPPWAPQPPLYWNTTPDRWHLLLERQNGRARRQHCDVKLSADELRAAGAQLPNEAEDLGYFLRCWPGVASWNDPIVDHDVDHEVKR